MTPRLTLNITSSQKDSMGSEATKSFGIDGGTIGRSSNNDWALPDPDRFMSSQHALILYQDSEFFITDLSTNGVFINNADDALGKGNTCTLNKINTITVGKFTISVEIQSEDRSSDVETMIAAPSNDPFASTGSLMDELSISDDAQDPMDFLAKPQGPASSPPTNNLLGEISEPQSALLGSDLPEDLFDENREFASAPSVDDAFVPPNTVPDPFLPQTPVQPTAKSGIPENWDQTTFTKLDKVDIPEDPFATSTSAIPSVAPQAQVPPSTYQAEQTLVSQAPEVPLAKPGNLGDLLHHKPTPSTIPTPNIPQVPPSGALNLERSKAAFRESGLDPSLLDDMNFIDSAVSLLPHVLEGLLSTLRSRAEIKNELRASKTILQQVENNPLKFSVNIQDAAQNMFVNLRPGFLDPQESVKQAFSDLTQHETALITGIQSGLNALLGKISPESIETKIENLENKKNLFGKISSSKKWGYYKETYQHIMEHSNDSFIDMFGDDFLKGYESYISKHK